MFCLEENGIYIGPFSTHEKEGIPYKSRAPESIDATQQKLVFKERVLEESSNGQHVVDVFVAEDLSSEELDGRQEEERQRLELYREHLLTTLASFRYEQESSGIEIGGKIFATDRHSVAVLNQYKTQALEKSDLVIMWKNNGQFTPLPASEIINVSGTIMDHINACFVREADLTKRIMAAELNDLENINIYEGWPHMKDKITEGE